MESKKIFAQRLVKLREDRGITQQILADDLKISRQSLSLYENAERTINIDLLVKIAKYFNVSTDYLLGLNDNATNNIDERVVCDYTGLSDNSVRLLNLLNQVKQLNISDCQPSIIDILDEIFSEIDKEYYRCLFLLRDAININPKKDDTNFLFDFRESKENMRVISSYKYREYLMQECKMYLGYMSSSVLKSMSGNYKFHFEFEPMRESLSQICERMISNNSIVQEVPDNGNNNPKEE